MNAVAENREVDLSFVDSTARIAVYDDLLSSPRILEIQPNGTREFIGQLSSQVYESAKLAGGRIPYSVIAQVAENFIHSFFTEVVVSILDDGNTIRFSDQGPGIPDKKKALTPGFSSATAQMKQIIHGVGSGLPIVREYMLSQSGHITIEDNMTSGAVVTITLNPIDEDASTDRDAARVDASQAPERAGVGRPKEGARSSSDHEQPMNAMDTQAHSRLLLSQISPRQQSILRMFSFEDILSITEISTELNIASSSAHYDLKKLEELGIVKKIGKRRTLTELGEDIIGDLAF